MLEGPEFAQKLVAGVGAGGCYWNHLSCFLQGPPQTVRRARAALEMGEHLVSVYGPPAERLPSCWTLWVQKGLGELTGGCWGSQGRRGGKVRTEPQNTSGCQGLLPGVPLRPVSQGRPEGQVENTHGALRTPASP